DASGIDPEQLNNYISENGGALKNYRHASSYINDDFFGIDCDIIIPAAMGNQITIDNAGNIKAVVIAEGANGPVDTDANDILLERGVEIIPDIFCNSGGVIASYFEWLQNRNGELWQMDEVLSK